MKDISNIVNTAMACQKNEYCTNCPVRRGCFVRKNFYCSTEEFVEQCKQTNIQVMATAISMGYSPEKAISECAGVSNAISKKRDREIKEHPTYSYE